MGISFSNGTTPDAAVIYTDPTALCGSSALSTTMNVAANAQNFKLPLNSPGCTQRIGMSWVASVSNLLAFAIDRAGLTFGANTACDDPLLLYNAMVAVVDANTQKIVTNQNLYVDTNGNDNNDGLTPQTAKKTILAAANYGVSSFNFVNLTINLVSPGQYVAPVPLPTGSGKISIIGNSQNQANYVLTGVSDGRLGIMTVSGTCELIGLTILNNTNDGTADLAIVSGAVVNLQNISLISTVANKPGGAHILNFGFCLLGAGIIASGDSGALFSNQNGNMVETPNSPVVIQGNATYTQATLVCNKLASFDINGSTITATGTVTGYRYQISNNSVIITSGGGANAIPGSIAGQTLSGGQYS